VGRHFHQVDVQPFENRWVQLGPSVAVADCRCITNSEVCQAKAASGAPTYAMSTSEALSKHRVRLLGGVDCSAELHSRE
jgi:hypothetical protein